MGDVLTSADITARFPLEETGSRYVRQIRDLDRVGLASLFNDLGYKVGVEVGVEKGYYSEILCQQIPGLHLYCVDPWKAYKGFREHTRQEKMDIFKREAQERLSPYGVRFIEEFSVEAAKTFEDGALDFVYIDGNHELSHVIADLTAWSPKVRKGGMVSGHDWTTRKGIPLHVQDALTAYMHAWDIKPLFLVGHKEQVEGERRDRARSWFWVVE